MSTDPTPNLESVWEEREDTVYPALFGATRRGIFTLTVELFTEVFGQDEVDPRWLHHGVWEFAPTKHRASWLYATSGASNPWDDDPEDYDREAYSGIGTELVMEVPAQADWAVRALQRLLAYNILLAHGLMGDAEPLDHGHRVPLGGPINGEASCIICFVALGSAEHYASTFTLPSGMVDLLHVVGLSQTELEYAKRHSTAALIEVLAKAQAFPVTDPSRAAIL